MKNRFIFKVLVILWTLGVLGFALKLCKLSLEASNVGNWTVYIPQAKEHDISIIQGKEGSRFDNSKLQCYDKIHVVWFGRIIRP